MQAVLMGQVYQTPALNSYLHRFFAFKSAVQCIQKAVSRRVLRNVLWKLLGFSRDVSWKRLGTELGNCLAQAWLKLGNRLVQAWVFGWESCLTKLNSDVQQGCLQKIIAATCCFPDAHATAKKVLKYGESYTDRKPKTIPKTSFSAFQLWQ